MTAIDELRAAVLAANDAAEAKLDAGDIDEARRLLAQATKLNKAILEWNEGQLLIVVTEVEAMVAEERRKQSDILGRLQRLAASVRGEAGLAPASSPAATASAPVARPTQPPLAPVVAPVAIATPVDPSKRDADLAMLHPVVREKVEKVIADLKTANIPMKVFEAYRSPERQRMLFGKGRLDGVIVDRSKVVTFADAWSSYHQYGMAVDMVIDNPPMGMWEIGGEADAFWAGYHEIARKHGLEPLSFETPHVQLIDAKASRLLAGEYPEGGDASWAENLAAAINRWPEAKKPPLPDGGERPSMLAAGGAAAAAGIDWAALPPVVESPFKSRFGGRAWRVDRRGVFLADDDAPQRTPGAPLTAGRIVELFGPMLAAASAKHGVAPELLLMTIATETAVFRKDGYTGPRTFRWESHFTVRNTGDATLDGNETGDYSAGPMQVMADTARGVNAREGLGHDNAKDFKFFKNKPAKTPAELGLYNPEICIDVGACFIRRQLGKTEGDPILVAAAYNAGSVRASGTSLWGIHAHGDHLDRAARWFGDACEVLAALGR